MRGLWRGVVLIEAKRNILCNSWSGLPARLSGDATLPLNKRGSWAGNDLQ